MCYGGLAGHKLFRSDVAVELMILSLTATGSIIPEKSDETT